jgi:hypothetical protein
MPPSHGLTVRPASASPIPAKPQVSRGWNPSRSRDASGKLRDEQISGVGIVKMPTRRERWQDGTEQSVDDADQEEACVRE